MVELRFFDMALAHTHTVRYILAYTKEATMHFTKDNGEIVDAGYVRARAVNALSRFRRIYTIEQRRAAIARTVDRPEWMRGRTGQTVGSIVREVERAL